MAEYKSNSHRSKEEANLPSEKKVEKVVTGKVITKKKSSIGKVADNFINEDMNNVKNYVLIDVLIPAIKKAISDIVTNGIDMILYGETGRSKKSSTSYIPYNKYSDNRRDDRYSGSGIRSRSAYYIDDIVLESRGEAERVLDQMDDILDVYKNVSVLDLYELCGIRTEPTDNKYGWTDLRNAEIIRVRDGYLLKMPKASPFD